LKTGRPHPRRVDKREYANQRKRQARGKKWGKEVTANWDWDAGRCKGEAEMEKADRGGRTNSERSEDRGGEGDCFY